MRARVLTALLAFAVLALAGFTVPLLTLTASERTQQLTVARSGTLDRFATLTDQAERTGDTRALVAEATRYTQLYGEAVVIVDAHRAPVAQTGGMRASDPVVGRLVDAALRNQPVSPTSTLRPWNRDDRLFARPAGSGTRVTGAVVLRASVDAAAHDISVRWGLILLGTGLVAVACVVLALAATRWVVRPLHRLDRAVGELAAGLPPRQTQVGGPPELRKLVTGFNRMADTVTAALDQQRRLVADTSHQLRNPLTALRLRVDSLGSRLPPSASRTYSGVTSELERMERLLDDLLALATAEQRAGELTVNGRRRDERCDAAAVASDRVQLWRPVADQGGVSLRAHDSPIAMAACTETELAQVVDVLVDNALKYAGPGSEVVVDAACEGPWAVLEVQDNGPGLTKEELAHLGDRFWRSGRHRTVRGSGLGLAIVERIAAGRGGRLDFRAVSPHGLSVRVFLPRAPAGTRLGDGPGNAPCTSCGPPPEDTRLTAGVPCARHRPSVMFPGPDQVGGRVG
ncbi:MULTISPECIES: sensor histidine kinase [Streptomyces]|uniref:histidine kinase n=1 Tax=Streptomyces chartreusis NRRL 3882 TaxID=1079985 RepID=A0A2N9B3B7_STRCX|nr:HAMP domain-containing sensor histidine kinase [Streptomyces chartreusis]MYS89705.1 HAMP domain-containing protein [Streptomyces sp. SID5464]SOR77830.1 Signal transduction histidine-protein kinase ArlS [Streptomyces chartreusis NRRL 3882]